MPLVGGVQVACGSQVFGYQRGIFVGQIRFTTFDAAGQPAV
jgi:hypothetical protein